MPVIGCPSLTPSGFILVSILMTSMPISAKSCATAARLGAVRNPVICILQRLHMNYITPIFHAANSFLRISQAFAIYLLVILSQLLGAAVCPFQSVFQTCTALAILSLPLFMVQFDKKLHRFYLAVIDDFRKICKSARGGGSFGTEFAGAQARWAARICARSPA